MCGESARLELAGVQVARGIPEARSGSSVARLLSTGGPRVRWPLRWSAPSARSARDSGPAAAARRWPSRRALDVMVSSYVPSLRALRDARSRPPARRRRPAPHRTIQAPADGAAGSTLSKGVPARRTVVGLINTTATVADGTCGGATVLTVAATS